MKSFDEYVEATAAAHGHICAGQILGIRLALHGLDLLGLDDPTGKHRKRLITYVEIDRCATDAIGVVTGCRLGKMAATFCDLETGRAIRIAALESSKDRARQLYPGLESANQQQMRAYRELPDKDLFSHQWVSVCIEPRDLPGWKGPRIHCESCGEGISFRREVVAGNLTLCRACAGQAYYTPIAQ